MKKKILNIMLSLVLIIQMFSPAIKATESETIEIKPHQQTEGLEPVVAFEIENSVNDENTSDEGNLTEIQESKPPLEVVQNNTVQNSKTEQETEAQSPPLVEGEKSQPEPVQDVTNDLKPNTSASEQILEEPILQNSIEKEKKDESLYSSENLDNLAANSIQSLQNDDMKIASPQAFSATIPGLVYEIINTNEIEITDYTGSATSLVIPDTIDGMVVTKIGNNAFNGMTSFVTVVLPDSVTEIGYGAFSNCSNLTTINYPLNLDKGKQFQSNYVYSPFYNCPNLEEIIIPEGVTQVAEYIFRNHEYLKIVTLPSTLKTIENNAFEGCSSLASITIPETVTTIEESAFEDCTALTEIAIPNNITTIESSTFRGCVNLGKIAFPENLKEIKSSAFRDCDKLTFVSIPDSVTDIDSGAFSYCDNLYNINYPISLENSYRFSSSALGVFYQTPKLENVTIPEGVNKIVSNFFYNASSLKTIQLPNTLSTIESNGFHGCTNLKYITIPKSVSEIHHNAFDDISNLSFNTELNSFATIYAIDNNKRVITTNNNIGYESDLLNRSDSSFVVDANGALSNGYVQVYVNLSVKNEKWNTVEQKELVVKIPTGTQIVETSMRLNDNFVTDYELDESTITIPITDQVSSFKASFKVLEQRDFYSYALFSYIENNIKNRDVIGVIIDNYEVFSLSVDERTTKEVITVQGVASPNKDVGIYVDDTLQTTVRSNLIGAYITNVTLPVENGEKTYTVKSTSTDSDNQPREAKQEIKYVPGSPELTGFVFFQDGKTTNGIDLYAYGIQGIRPSITHIGSRFPYRFEVSFTNPEMIRSVVITSTRNNLKTSIPAVYDQDLGKFVAVGHFVDDEPMYVPGILRVEYTLKTEEVKVSENYDWEELALHENPALKNATVTPTDQGDTATGTIDFTGVDESLENQAVDYSLGNYQGEYGNTVQEVKKLAETNKNIQVYDLKGEDGNEKTAIIDYESAAEVTMVIGNAWDLGSKAIKYSLSFKDITDAGYVKWFDVAENLSLLSDASGFVVDAFEIGGEHEELVDEIMQSSTITDKGEALKKAEQLKQDRLLFSAIVTLIPMIIGGPVTAPAIILTGMIGIISYSSDFFWQHRISQITGNSHMINWHIDPSGYVYDIRTNERLPGVTTTVYCVLYDYSDEFWNNKPALDDYGTLWDASTASQENPLTTDGDGRYAWDVPEGWWRVKYEKEGYETTYSDWLPVPPPQTEVNIGMRKVGVEGTVFIFGEVSSYDPKKEVSITLFDKDDDDRKTPLYTSKIPADISGSGLKVQLFEVQDVPPGTYDMVISKQGHASVTVTDIVVADTDVVLTENLNVALKSLWLPAGDINGDGWVNFEDILIAIYVTNYGQQIGASGANPLADVTGDEWVNFEDLLVLIYVLNYGKGNVSIPFD